MFKVQKSDSLNSKLNSQKVTNRRSTPLTKAKIAFLQKVVIYYKNNVQSAEKRFVKL